MGLKSHDAWPVEQWRASAESVSDMKAQSWAVRSYCRSCQLLMDADLDIIILRKGPRTSLWNRQARCRRIGCSGVVEFQGRPPQIQRYLRLFAEWPKR